jgi:hypothetical protein
VVAGRYIGRRQCFLSFWGVRGGGAGPERRAPSGGPLCVGFLVPGVTRTGRNRIFYSAKKRGAFHLSPERSDRRGMPKKTELLLTHQHVTKKKWVLVRKPCPARRSLHDYSGM